jgi:hypothetical protein
VIQDRPGDNLTRDEDAEGRATKGEGSDGSPRAFSRIALAVVLREISEWLGWLTRVEVGVVLDQHIPGNAVQADGPTIEEALIAEEGKWQALFDYEVDLGFPRLLQWWQGQRDCGRDRGPRSAHELDVLVTSELRKLNAQKVTHATGKDASRRARIYERLGLDVQVVQNELDVDGGPKDLEPTREAFLLPPGEGMAPARQRLPHAHDVGVCIRTHKLDHHTAALQMIHVVESEGQLVRALSGLHDMTVYDSHPHAL